MNLRKQTVGLRPLASAVLLAWLTAMAFCAAHCSLGIGRGDSVQSSCHGPAASASHTEADHSSAPRDHRSESSCNCKVLKSALLTGNAPVLVPPDPHLLCLLPPFVALYDSLPAQPQTSLLRQSWRRDWVFTPEVSLGPAFRSLAPPFVS